MKKFLDNIFKPYLFPIIILIIGVYLKIGDNFKIVTEFFGDKSNSVLNSFNYQFYAWEILLYLGLSYFIFFILRIIKNKYGKSKSSIRMQKVIKKSPTEISVNNQSNGDKYLFKFKAIVRNEEYDIKKIKAFCLNCQKKPTFMDFNIYAGTFTCQCRRELNYDFSKNVRNQIISELEANTPK